MKQTIRIAGEVLGSHEGLLSNQVVRYMGGEFHTAMDAVALEAGLDVFLNGEKIASTMRTPGADQDLALGLLITSGKLPRRIAYQGIEFCGQAEAVRLSWRGAPPGEENPSRPSSRDSDMPRLAEDLLGMRAVLEERQRLHRHTGATHCAMFFDQDCVPISFGEDVGRHNAFDKCVGSAVRQDSLDRAHHAVVTSRLSHEIIKKAVSARVRVLAGFSVATSIAVDLARENGITLVGRLRDKTMIIYE